MISNLLTTTLSLGFIGKCYLLILLYKYKKSVKHDTLFKLIKTHIFVTSNLIHNLVKS